MRKFTHKLTRKLAQAPTNLTDATIFSKKYSISFNKSATKQIIENLVKQLIQNIGRPLSHNGIIVGHIKILAKFSEEEFLFLSLTKLDRVDVKPSFQWENELSGECNTIELDINVLVFGHSKKVIDEVVDGSLAILYRDSMSECCK
ncbi:hypothetical protein SRRS_32080 [Sporomusa rhizae]|uniref:hypothetical protein n=1 Tax=Sporomusa rhizae TaxID=357999 RepID=UPI00352A78E3